MFLKRPTRTQFSPQYLNPSLRIIRILWNEIMTHFLSVSRFSFPENWKHFLLFLEHGPRGSIFQDGGINKMLNSLSVGVDGLFFQSMKIYPKKICTIFASYSNHYKIQDWVNSLCLVLNNINVWPLALEFKSIFSLRFIEILLILLQYPLL